LCFRPIKAEQKPVIDDGWIIDAIRIHNHSAHHSAEFNQVVPIATVARQSGRFDTEDRAHFAATYISHQPLKSRAINQAGTGTAQVIVDHEDIPKSQLTRPIRKTVLSPLALLVVHYLAHRGLSDIDNRSPAKPITRQLRIHLRLPVPDRPRFRVPRRLATPRAREPVLFACRPEEPLPTPSTTVR
jgi:hypothetical protein